MLRQGLRLVSGGHRGRPLAVHRRHLRSTAVNKVTISNRVPRIQSSSLVFRGTNVTYSPTDAD